MSTLYSVCKQFDNESDVPATSSSHSTRFDKNDVQKVVSAVLNLNLEFQDDVTETFVPCG